MARMTIRVATIRDAPALAACIEAAYAVYKDRIPDLPEVSEGIAQDIEEKLVLVAIGDLGLLGGIILLEKADHLLLANVAVDPAASGQGVGRRLIARAEDEATRLGFSELRLSTHVDMPENVRFYEHLGWHTTGRAGNTVRMKKSI